jgi:hypothetical protein
MHRMTRRLLNLALPLFCAAALSACALGRSEVDIKAPTGAATNGTAFAKIVTVDDNRVFEASPSDAGTPSLQDASEITNKAITSRAIARKRGGYGNALGDVVLPEGKTVAGLVRSAAQKALQDKGYTVVEQGAPQYAAAAPLSIEIADFWSWVAPGFFTMNTEFKSTLNLTGDALVGTDPVRVVSHFKDTPFAVTEGVWADLVERGVNDISDQIEHAIKPAPGAP